MTTGQWVLAAVVCFGAATILYALGYPRVGSGFTGFALFGLVVLVRVWPGGGHE